MYPVISVCLLSLISLCSLLVISSTNPVDAVLLLVLVFLNSSVFLLLLGADFLALIFLIIYVGAIAVLFLFMVMMLNIKTEDRPRTLFAYLPFFFLYSFAFFFELALSISGVFLSKTAKPASWLTNFDSISQIDVLGQALFRNYYPCVLMAGMLLLIAMVGSIVLSFERKSKGARYSEVSKHISRSYGAVYPKKGA